MAKAAVTLQNPVSGEMVVQTDAEGRYEAQGLVPAAYRVAVSLAGFATQSRSGVEVAAGQSLEADFLLEPEESAPAAASESASQAPSRSGRVINESELTGLPLNGRSVSQLATLEAGVNESATDTRQGRSGGGNLTVSGGRAAWNNFLLDGTNINNSENTVPRSAAGGQLGADALAQIRVLSPQYDAQYGRAAGGVMSAVTRAGGNDWHGTAFEFLRNSKLDARNFFDGLQPPPFKRNQFGGTFSGPIVKDKTFFMVSSETLLDRWSITHVNFVPDNDVRAGVLALPGREPILVDPRIKPYLSLFPPAQRPLLDAQGRTTGIAENRLEIPLPTNEYFFVARVDQRLSDSDAWFARYTFDDALNISAGTTVQSHRNESRQQYLTFAETHFFSPSLLNTARLSYTRPVVQMTSNMLVDIPRSLYPVPSSPQFGGFIVPGLNNFTEAPEVPSGRMMNSYQFADDLVLARNAHTLKFGMVADRYQWNVFDHLSMGGRWTFSSVEDFLLAGPNGTRLEIGLPESIPDRAYRQSLFGFYIQDDFRARPNLTLNLGLRYEFTTMIHDARGRTVFLLDELRDREPRIGPFMSKNPSLLNVAPRLGIRWSPGGSSNTVLSGGFGIYHDQIIEYSIDDKGSTIPFFKFALRPNFDASKTFPDAVLSAGVADQIRIFEYSDPRQPIVYRYNFSLQQELAGGLTLQAGYVGAMGRHLLRTIESNQFPFPVRRADGALFFPADCDSPELAPQYRNPSFCQPGAGPRNPAFGSMHKTNTDGQSFYNAVLLSIRSTLGRGLSFGGNYTYAKNMDDSSSGAGGG
ncbi:MAG: TonB-dependent receptor, partial [Acidobacteria bacterium]|nr:TonB-dependent receptor [Acidobacteriota bacterium]